MLSEKEYPKCPEQVWSSAFRRSSVQPVKRRLKAELQTKKILVDRGNDGLFSFENFKKFIDRFIYLCLFQLAGPFKDNFRFSSEKSIGSDVAGDRQFPVFEIIRDKWNRIVVIHPFAGNLA